MKITPVKRYKPPRFPIHDVLRDHPELLRLVPKRWVNSPLVLSALSFACLILTSCNRADSNAIAWDDAMFGEASIEQSEIPCDLPASWHDRCAGYSIVPVVPAKNQRIAPIFQHGEGRGAYGCVSTAAPLFLTEDEARKVIMEEAASAGINFEPDIKTLDAVDVPLSAMKGSAKKDSDLRTGVAKIRTNHGQFVLDGTDRQRNISYEFVSNQDFGKWDFDYHPDSSSSVDSFDIRYTAEALRHNLTKIDDIGVVGVFYEPVRYLNHAGSEQTEQAERRSARNESIEDLRQQVRDFIFDSLIHWHAG